MAPIRVGIIGLSSQTTNISRSPGDGWAASAHLPYLVASPHYEITALCNSSVESAQAAIKRYGLPSSTKTYGNPEDIAKDPDVDLVVCCVRVDRHHQLIMPSLKAGKAAFVEWPLGSNLQQAEEMLATAKQSGSKTFVAAQGRVSPITQKIKELVDSKAIGELLSSTFTHEAGYPGEIEMADFTAKKAVGGNLHTILFGHVADSILYALGGLDELSALLTTRWPETKLLHQDGTFDRMMKRETPDHIMLQGVLSGSRAPISMYLRNGKAFKDTRNIEWRIFGTKGQIRVTAHAAMSLALGGEKIELYDHETDAVKEVDVQYADAVKDLPNFAKNIGALYEGFVHGGTVEEGFVDFEQAVGLHRLMENMEKSSEERKYVKMGV